MGKGNFTEDFKRYAVARIFERSQWRTMGFTNSSVSSSNATFHSGVLTNTFSAILDPCEGGCC